MKFTKHRRFARSSPASQPPPHPPHPPERVRIPEPASPAVIVARAFTRIRLVHRARVLRRLLMPIGPMALTVVAGGVFAKYVEQARWSRFSVTLDDAASVTASQVQEIARYVEQSNPQALQQVLMLFARDATMMSAVGASIAALMLRHMDKHRRARSVPAYAVTATPGSATGPTQTN